MNIPTEKVEQLLRKAPNPSAPAGLLEDLRADIILPRTTSRLDHGFRPPSFLRRWMPALSLAVWLTACLVLLGVQLKRVADLKAENARLLASATERTSQNASAMIVSPNEELSRLRAENEEAARLRAEVKKLQEQLAMLNALRAENEQLAKDLQNRTAPAGEQDFVSAMAEKGERIRCINNLKQVGLAAHIYASKHGGVMPNDYASMQSQIRDDSVTFCPAGDGSVRYEIVSPGESVKEPQLVFAKCNTHNHALLLDGSAHQLGNRRQVAPRADGKMIIVEKADFE